MKRRSKFDKGILFIGLILAVLASTAVFLYFQVRTDRFAQALEKEEPIGLMVVLGGPERPRWTQVVLYHPLTRKAALIDIPGNIGSVIEEHRRVDRVDVLYSPDNLDSYIAKVSSLIGHDIPFYLHLSPEGVERSADLMGGIDVFIATPVELLDQPEVVLLPSGNVRLDGAKTRIFVSYEDASEAEIDRIGRYQKYVQSLLKRMGEMAPFLLREEVFPYLRSAIRTNLDSRSLRSFIDAMVDLDVDRMAFLRVLGNVRPVDNQDLLFPHFEGNLLRQTVAQIVAGLASGDAARAEGAIVNIEILNGTRTPGLARRTRDIFKSFGYNVVSVANADSTDHEKTVVMDRRGTPELARRVAEIIRCRRVVTEIIDDVTRAQVDVTIILGADFDGRYCRD